MFSATTRHPSRRAGGLRPAAVLAASGAALLLLIGAVTPYRDPATAAEAARQAEALDDQSLDVSTVALPSVAERDAPAAEVSPARQKAILVADHTNYSWAKLILWYGGWPITDAAVTTIVRWMRQENGVDNWWNRNNPLNNGWGIGDYMASNENLDMAAMNVADALNSLGGYAGIRAALAVGTGSPDDIWYAIWNSSWASGHYNGGTHYSTAPVPEVVAPAEAWGI
ncbi:MAG: hypothetical protein J7480_08130 [Microbacteriaceae bacterium]|nr:hypothetical protein [Microbacteriaceae bacterium]